MVRRRKWDALFCLGFAAVSVSSAQPRPRCFTALANALELPKAQYLRPCHRREGGRSPQQVIYNPAEHWPLLLPLSIPSAGRTLKHCKELRSDSETVTSVGGVRFFRASGRIHHKRPLLGPGFLQRSCWVLHTLPPTKSKVDPKTMKVLLPEGDEEKRLSCNVGSLGTVGHPGLVLFFAEVLH